LKTFSFVGLTIDVVDVSLSLVQFLFEHLT